MATESPDSIQDYSIIKDDPESSVSKGDKSSTDQDAEKLEICSKGFMECAGGVELKSMYEEGNNRQEEGYFGHQCR